MAVKFILMLNKGKKILATKDHFKNHNLEPVPQFSINRLRMQGLDRNQASGLHLVHNSWWFLV